jgi:oligopeptide transport system permease protein
VITRIWGGGVLLLFFALVGISFFAYEIPVALWWIFGASVLGGAAAFTVSRGLTLFVGRRLLETVFTVWVIATLTFCLLRVLPGGPFDAEKVLPAEIMENLNKKYHMNDPLLKQYGDYMVGLLHGDLGQSYKYVSRGITPIIMESLPASLQLGVYALIVAYLVGIPCGIIAGWKQGTAWDFGPMFVAISGVALPSFLIAPIFILLFAKWLGWLEPALWEGPLYYIMPMVILGIRPASVIARLTRASVLEVVHSDYIRTARAKGLGARKILFKHVLRNSLIPVLSFSGPMAAATLTGSFVIEMIFAVPGIAKHTVLGVTNRDYPLVLGATLLFSLMLVLANLITDLMTVIVDPRVKMS